MQSGQRFPSNQVNVRISHPAAVYRLAADRSRALASALEHAADWRQPMHSASGWMVMLACCDADGCPSSTFMSVNCHCGASCQCLTPLSDRQHHADHSIIAQQRATLNSVELHGRMHKHKPLALAERLPSSHVGLATGGTGTALLPGAVPSAATATAAETPGVPPARCAGGSCSAPGCR